MNRFAVVGFCVLSFFGGLFASRLRPSPPEPAPPPQPTVRTVDAVDQYGRHVDSFEVVSQSPNEDGSVRVFVKAE